MTEKLRHLGPEHTPRDRVDYLLERYFLTTFNLRPSSLENIPLNGAFVLGFMPHSGTFEPTAIDSCIRSVGRTPPVWITKEEN